MKALGLGINLFFIWIMFVSITGWLGSCLLKLIFWIRFTNCCLLQGHTDRWKLRAAQTEPSLIYELPVKIASDVQVRPAENFIFDMCHIPHLTIWGYEMKTPHGILELNYRLPSGLPHINCTKYTETTPALFPRREYYSILLLNLRWNASLPYGRVLPSLTQIWCFSFVCLRSWGLHLCLFHALSSHWSS